ncbi:HlyD family efflux transporter periplasmic adaptor subunit [Thalassotalea ponticola]|uniref:HlyD family efflux transporter periplasmic adaptor subunit n=1 Tax=Thalassotalea ponticola TaxID=1523392 RepID=UPI0025B3AD44|nr:HlyD family efflux transporter periplasmic adaptor subunit [Thalassotalea ponticola]MDN3653288.1 HlyD family efflux transporter periplasmic adaptor subunit [Thalassotalea ponticola]
MRNNQRSLASQSQPENSKSASSTSSSNSLPPSKSANVTSTNVNPSTDPIVGASNEVKKNSQHTKRLFRTQVMQSKNRFYCDVSIKQPISFAMLTALLMLLVAVCLWYLLNHQYTRKTHVSGYIQPIQGLVTLNAERQGLIKRVEVEEGEKVSPGDVLMVIEQARLSHNNQQLDNVYQNQIMTLQESLAFLVSEQNNLLKLQQLKRQSLALNASQTSSILDNVKRQLTALVDKINHENKRLTNFNNLHANGYLASDTLMLQKQKLISLEQQRLELEQQVLQHHAQIANINQQLEQLDYSQSSALAENKHQQQRVKQQLSEAMYQRQYSVVAQTSGTITNLRYKQGQSVSAGDPLLTIVPSDATMEAVLLVPTRGFGFIEKGHVTQLKYQAFPYQHFGMYQGKVVSVANAVITRADHTMPLRLQEPVYKVTVALDKQTVNAYGRSIALRPGMLLQAEIALDKRSLMHWLLEPIYSLKGRS